MNIKQEKAMSELRGLKDQIEKQHWLNIHFRAFQLANYAWQQHILVNAQLGAERVNSPSGAVLDDKREDESRDDIRQGKNEI